MMSIYVRRQEYWGQIYDAISKTRISVEKPDFCMRVKKMLFSFLFGVFTNNNYPLPY